MNGDAQAERPETVARQSFGPQPKVGGERSGKMFDPIGLKRDPMMSGRMLQRKTSFRSNRA